METTPCLATQWLPTAPLGAEALRERAASSALPPLYFLHVWWARRPLIVSRAAVLASLLPIWERGGGKFSSSQELLEQLFNTEEEYHQWFLKVLGIHGNPVHTRQQIQQAKIEGKNLGSNPYGYKRAFTFSPSRDEVDWIRSLAVSRYESASDQHPVVLDPFGGGGSIPFEAARYGCLAKAIELNPVALSILSGTITQPFIQGPRFKSVIEKWGKQWCTQIEKRLQDYFHHEHNETIRGYIWAHTVPCPATGHQTPLLPNHWLARTDNQKVAVRLLPDCQTGDIQIEILDKVSPAEGNLQTYKHGVATSVFSGDTFDGNYITKEAQAGRMEYLLLAVAYRPTNGKGTRFRAPVQEDLDAIEKSESHVQTNWDDWDAKGYLPTEAFPPGSDSRPLKYGMNCWCDMFTPRQLLTLVTALDELHQILDKAKSKLNTDKLKALNLYLAFALDKVVDYNSRLAVWHSSRHVVAHVFTHHAFPFRSTFAELEGVDACQWGLKQIVSCYRDLSKLAVGSENFQQDMNSSQPVLHPGEPTLASATNLPYRDGSVDAIVTDPPYYDNVMYAELSDYFYVWQKRSLAPCWPELGTQYLTDKDNEAVANKQRFADLATHAGRGRKPPGTHTAQDLAEQHYETLMSSSFREAHRVLRNDGAMTVMFTHKKTEAWNLLATALLNAGFQIASAWPVTTESSHSLHQRGKNAANSTILLTCMKRTASTTAFWQEIQNDVRQAARHAAIENAKTGLTGVDVTLASFGPALSVLSQQWPVYTGELDAQGNRMQVSPEQALDLARQEVSRTKLERLLAHNREVDFDPPTNWWLLAWMDFQAAKFPASEAIKLSHATHMDLETELRRKHRLVDTRSGTAEILTPVQRLENRSFALDAEFPFETWIDRLHALMVTYEHDGLNVARDWLRQTGLDRNDTFHALVEAAIKAVPRQMDRQDRIALNEARILESIRITLFGDIEVAPPSAPTPEQLTLDSQL